MPANNPAAYLPKTGLSLADLGPMIRPYQSPGVAPALQNPGSAGPSFAPQQDVRQQELADLFQTQASNLRTTGQGILDSAVALAPELREVAGGAYRAGLEAQNLDRVTNAVNTASTARKSAVQQTLDNLKAQAQVGYDTARRGLDSERAAMGLPSFGSSFFRNLGNAYYRNFLPVEAQALALQSQNIEADLASEQQLKNLELAAAAQRAAGAGQYATALTQPIGLQMGALSQLGSAIGNLAPLADRAYYNYVQGDDGLGGQVPGYNLSYSVPGMEDPGYNLLASAPPGGDSYNRFATSMNDRPAAQNRANQEANARYYGGRQSPVYGPMTQEEAAMTVPAIPSPLWPRYIPLESRNQVAASNALSRRLPIPDNLFDFSPGDQATYLRALNRSAEIDPLLYQ
jgi:hypothetical protein